MKKRYSNFHRARKWHRKFCNVLYDPEDVRIWLVDHYKNLYEKYYTKAIKKDLAIIDHYTRKSADSGVWILKGFAHRGNRKSEKKRAELSRKTQIQDL